MTEAHFTLIPKPSNSRYTPLKEYVAARKEMAKTYRNLRRTGRGDLARMMWRLHYRAVKKFQQEFFGL